MPTNSGGDGWGAEGDAPFDREFLEVVETVHPELETREELLDAAYRMTAVAELATEEKSEATDPDRGPSLPPQVLTEFGRMLVEGFRPELVRYLRDTVVVADPPEEDAVRLLGKLRRWDDEPANRHRAPEMGLATFFVELQAVARTDFFEEWRKRKRSE